MARNKNVETSEEMPEQSGPFELEENHAEPRVYELGFHIDGELTQEDAKKAYQALKDLAAAHGTARC